jgi:hypothetical protein
LLDIVVAAGAAGLLALGTMEDDQVFTTAGLTALAVAVGKSVLTAGLSFAARLAVPPADKTAGA